MRLENTVRPYAWGSTDFIPALLGTAPSGEPAAELWIGTHPGAPSRIADSGQTLGDAIAQEPASLLGSDVVDRFGPDLPFLLKVLAAAEPLSIQAHPTIEQAQAGFADENARRIPLGAAHRNYADANHKPELISALTPFRALCGFRHVPATARLLEVLIAAGADGLAGFPQRLLAEGGLREVVTAVLSMPDDAQSKLQSSVLPACASVAGLGGEWADEAANAVALAQRYPNDSGVVVSLLMNLMTLEPGDALFLGAGRIHSYLEGAGVELMARSDNVLRSGLTPKHIDVSELLRVLDFTTEDPAPMPVVRSDGVTQYLPPIPDFALSRVDLDGTPVALAATGPRVVLCTEGAATARSGGEIQALERGQTLFAAAGNGLDLDGTGVVFVATTNL